MGRLIEDHGPLLPPERVQVAAAVLLVHSKEPLKGEASRGLPRGRQGGDQGTGSGDGHHRHAVLGAQGHQILSRVGDGGGTRIGNQCAVFPGQQPLQDTLAAVFRVVAVVGDHGLFQLQMVEELHGHPGIFGGNEVRLGHGLGHTGRDVP